MARHPTVEDLARLADAEPVVKLALAAKRETGVFLSSEEVAKLFPKIEPLACGALVSNGWACAWPESAR